MLADPCNFCVKEKFSSKAVIVETKYDGERVQIHRFDGKTTFFSRNLKPVQSHKVEGLEKELEIFGDNCILDSEIVMMKDDSILPFGTLGKHKAKESEGVSTLFIFDCLKIDGVDIMNEPINERKKKIGVDGMTFNGEEVDETFYTGITTPSSRIRLSNHYTLEPTEQSHLPFILYESLKKDIEGLVIKPIDSIYEPGKRRWFKIKKDYVNDGEVADSADLTILGCSYGTGRMAAIYSIFLVGCFDKEEKVWKTVTKVHSGLTYSGLEKLNLKLKDLIQKFESSQDYSWLKIDKTLYPTFIAIDPWKMPVLEVRANAFTKSDVHTAAGISMRFPRIVKIREDKDAIDSNSLDEIINLFKNVDQEENLSNILKRKCNSEVEKTKKCKKTKKQ
jgi:DNA ligase-3